MTILRTANWFNVRHIQPQPLPGEWTHIAAVYGPNETVLFLNGQIRCLRISRGERYSVEFDPESSFVPDAAEVPHRAVLIYDASKVEGERVIDVSGEGSDGVLARPE